MTTYRAWNLKPLDRSALKELTAAIAQQSTEELESRAMETMDGEPWSEEKYQMTLAAQQKEAGLLAGILAARGITDPAEALTLLSGEEELTDPMLLTDMDKACARILDAIDREETIVVFGDYDVDGVPATANHWLMTNVLRKQWGFNGFVVTGFTGISEMVEHGIGNLQTVSARALNAGVDMDMVSEGFVGTLKKSFTEGKITMKTLDAACRRILEAKYKLGLFDDPYKYCDLSRPARDIFTREHRDAARRIAAESFVLLKNEPFEGQGKKSSRPVLPLEKQGTVAVIGPLGNTRSNMPGTWSVAARLDDYPSLYEGLKEMTAGRVNITYAKGSNLIGDAAYEERATMFGRSLNRDNRTDKELLDEALKTAAGADVIIAALGESSEMSGESSSRTDLDIPDVQRTLLEALLKTGKPVVLTLFTGRPLTLTWEQEHVPAILNVWFGGSEAAYAIGDVLFGDVNPSGKLTMTFPKNVGQIPLFYNHKNTGRPLAAGNWFEKFRSNYLDVDNEPLYPFGYGLSYTTFR